MKKFDIDNNNFFELLSLSINVNTQIPNVNDSIHAIDNIDKTMVNLVCIYHLY